MTGTARRPKSLIGRCAPIAVALALGGCSMAPHYARPESPVPLSWPAGDAYLVQTEASLSAVRFGDVFTDPRLQALLDQALANNRDLRVAYANVTAAQTQAAVQRAQQFPPVNLSLAETRRTGNAARGGFVGPQTTATGSLGFSAFELDLFGRLASASASQRNTALATEAAARTLRATLTANLVVAWAGHAADSELLRLAEATAVSARRTLTLTDARLRGGVAPRSDLRQAEQLLAAAEADLAVQRTAVAQDRNLIALLVGAPVDPALLPDDLAAITASLRPLSAGQQSDVLLRRPDVVEAEYRLRAANADVGAARAALFPRISLTVLFGLASETLEGLFGGSAGASSTSTQAGTATYPLFAAGGARANLRVNKARLQAAVAAYERTIQGAFREVGDALARQGTFGDELAAVQRQAAATADTARLVEARYRGGVASALENLDAQRSDYAARRRLLAVQLGLIVNRAELYRALGGDPQVASPSPEGPAGGTQAASKLP